MHTSHICSIFVLAIASSIAPAQAKCCGAGECVSWSPAPGKPGQPDREICNRWKCADGFHHGPFQCCGVSKCNIACCNCDSKNGKVCRESTTLLAQGGGGLQATKIEDMPMTDADMFKAANTGGTGNLTLAEFAFFYFGAAHAGEEPDPALAAKFDLYDKNGDGFLQVDEMRLD